MQIVRLTGGLANQIMEYIYGRYLECKTGETVYYDDMRMAHSTKNGYELERVFGLYLPLLSRCLPKLTVDRIVRMTSHPYNESLICQQMYDAGVDIEILWQKGAHNQLFTGNIITITSENNDMAFQCVKKSRLHWGYGFQFRKYYQEKRDMFDKELIFPPFPDENSYRMAQEIKQCNSVGIHVRRGDFAKLNWLTNPEYYRRCIEYVETHIKPDKYYLFTDDMKYLKEHISEYGGDKIKLEFVEGHNGVKDYLDFQLMTLCKHLIVAPRSTFSGVAAMLSKYENHGITHKTIGMKYEDTYLR